MAQLSDHDDIQCCGIKELRGISNRLPQDILNDIAEEWFVDVPRAYMIFSCESKYAAGRQLEKFIKHNNLGTVVRTKSKVNPNSGNLLSVWLWAVNNTAFKKWSGVRKQDWW